MIGYPPLRKVVGADALVAVAGADLGTAIRRDGRGLFLLFLLQQAGTQHPHRLVFVFELAALILAFHHHAGGQVGDADGGFGFVDVLSARAAGTKGVNLQIGGIDVHIHLVRFGQHRHRGGGGVHPPAGFGFRHPLHTVHAAFIFQPAVCTLTGHHKADFFITAQLGFIAADHLGGKAFGLGVHGVHPVQRCGKQCRFLAARTAANLHDDIAVVVGVAGQQQQL